jgi:transmembrane sensor
MSLLGWLRPRPRPASEWFARVRSGQIDTQGDRDYVKWLADTPAHEEEYEARERAWEFTADVREAPGIRALLCEVDQKLAAQTAGAGTRRARPWRPRLAWPTALAAAASLAVLTGIAFWFIQHAAPSGTDYATAIGEQRIVTLADNSSVSLNTNTAVHVVYTRGARRVDLMRGEAVFGVAKDAARPFEVHALHGVTIAVGTQFEVQVTGSGATVSVLEGTVTVRGSESATDSAQLSAGQGVDYSAAGVLSAPRPADTLRIRAWQTQRIVFNDVPLARALEEYNRYLKTPIVLADPGLGDRHINGVFHIGDEDAFLGALEQGLHVKASRGEAQTLLQPP